MKEDMKALLVNGSPRANGNTMRALEEVASALRAEGMQTMRLLGRNLAWMAKSLKTDIPAREPWTMTNFIR